MPFFITNTFKRDTINALTSLMLINKSCSFELNTDNFLQQLEDCIISHNAIVAAVSSVSAGDRKEWFVQQEIDYNKSAGDTKANGNIFQAYTLYRKQLSRNAATAEGNAPLDSLINANKEMGEALKRMVGYVKSEVGDASKIPFQDFRISTVTAMGILNASDTLISFTTYMFSGMVSKSISKAYESLAPKYRYDYLVSNCANIANLVNCVYDKGGLLNIVEEIDRIKSTGGNVPINNLVKSATSGTTMDILNGVFEIGRTVLNLIGFFIPVLRNIMNDNAGLAYDRSMMKKHQKRKEMREWMAKHVALLRMELAETSPDDANYNRLVKIINAYDEKITEYDKAIAKFEEDIMNVE